MINRTTSPQSNSTVTLFLTISGIVCIVLIIGLNLLPGEDNKLTDNGPYSQEEIFQVKNSSQKTPKENISTLPPKVQVVSKTTGIMEYISPELKAGQIIPKGYVFMHLDNTVQQVQLQRALANAAQAQSRLEHLERIAINAHAQWEKFQTRRYFDPDPLIHYEPYIIQASLGLTEALAHADNARVNLEKTIFRASAASKILSVNVSPGERVYPGTILAVLTELEKDDFQ